jgi:hypothetical protein
LAMSLHWATRPSSASSRRFPPSPPMT